MVELAPLTDPAAVPDAIATTLGVTPQAGDAGDPDAGRGAVGATRAHRARQLRARRRRGRRRRSASCSRGRRRCACSRPPAKPSTSRASSDACVLPLTLDGGVELAGGDAVRRAGPRAPVPHRLRRAGDRGGRRRDLPEPRRAPARHRAGRGADDLDEPDRHPRPARRPVPHPHRRRRAPRGVSRRCATWSRGPTSCSTTTSARCCAAPRCSPVASTSPRSPRCSAADDELAVLDLIDSLVRKSLVIADNAAGTGPLRRCSRRSGSSPRTSSPRPARSSRRATGTPSTSPARRPRAGRAGTARRGATASTGWRSSSPTSAPRSGGAGLAATSRPRPTSRRTPRSWVPRSSCSRRSAGRRSSSRTRRRADVRHLPRLYTGAAWGCFTGRPAEAVAAAQTRGRLEADPRYEPCEPGLSGLIEALAHVYAGHLDRYVDVAERVAALPGNARGWGLSLLLDGLQASGRVDEALALTDDAMAAARALGNPYFIAYAYWTSGSAHSPHRPRPRPRPVARGPRLRAPAPRRLLRRLHRARRGAAAARRRRPRRRARHVRRGHRRVPAGGQRRAAHDHPGQRDRAVRTHRPARQRGHAATRRSSASPGSDHHVPDLPELAGRLAAKLGAEAFRRTRRRGCGDGPRRHGALRPARDPAGARRAPRAGREPRQHGPAGSARARSTCSASPPRASPPARSRERLYISAKTADRHIQNLYTKIGASNRAAATRWAVEHGLVD